ncbi:hypothetical protein Efla_004482 [Eimeria flavescens]
MPLAAPASSAVSPLRPTEGSGRSICIERRGSCRRSLLLPLLLGFFFFTFSLCAADRLGSAERQQTLRRHGFRVEPTTPAGSLDAKHKIAASLGLSHPGEERLEGEEEATGGPLGDPDPAAAYADILEKLESIVRQEDSGRTWLHIALEPSSADSAAADESGAGGGEGAAGGGRGAAELPVAGGASLLSALQMSASEAEETKSANQAQERPSEGKGGRGEDTDSSSGAADRQEADANSQVLIKAITDFQVIEEENGLDTDSLVTIAYNFPLQTEESKQIAFVVMALPPGTLDEEMPELSCTTRKAHMKNRPESLSTFITISSANPRVSLPLGRHSFRIAVHTPEEALAIDNPANWWFATFRFTGGHAITKHWENRKLISKQKCIWGQWRRETPCSTTCGSGFEIWTRTLYSGDSESACGGALMKRKCQLQECSLSCQLDDWITLADCTKSCGATEAEAFKIRMRKVLLRKAGWGRACAELYPWDYHLGMGWSEKMQAVVSISSCEERFAAPCPATLGCRVEERNARTIPDAFPWGACPFPCGGFGSITSVVQVANGIPRWIGEKEFPESFQIPCKADTEPLVTTRKCNIAACEDCSVYLENPIFGRATRAWFFFIPTAEADTAEVVAPRGVSIIKAKAQAREKKEDPGRGFKISALSDVLPPPAAAAAAQQQQQQLSSPSSTADVLLLADELGTCDQMATSFGGIHSCNVFPSKHYPGSQAAELVLKALIEPTLDASSSSRSSSSSSRSSSSGSGSSRGSSSRRPQWFALPVLLGKREEMEDMGNFYLWLTRSKYPNDPEVFKCHLRTQLDIPRRCKFAYRPRNPQECENCTAAGSLQIETYRQFIPSEHGGTCSIPHAQQQKAEVLVTTSCLKSCSQLHQRKAMPGKEGALSREQQQQEEKKEEQNSPKMASRLERISRRDIETLVTGKTALHAAAAAGDKFALKSPDFLFKSSRLPTDEEAMPTRQEEGAARTTPST